MSESAAIEQSSEIYDAVFAVVGDLIRQAEARPNRVSLEQEMSVGGLAARVGARLAPTALRPNVQSPPVPPAAATPELRELVSEAMWHLVGQAILVPRRITDAYNSFFYPTAYGRALLLSEVDAGPYDPEGFLAKLGREAPGLEPLTQEVMHESIRCYSQHLLRSSAVMLGLASEVEILKLIEMLPASLDQALSSRFVKRVAEARTMKAKYRVLEEHLGHVAQELPESIREIDAWLTPVFNFIRFYRNEAGHPFGFTATRAEIYQNLTIFRRYAQKLSLLKEHLAITAQPASR